MDLFVMFQSPSLRGSGLFRVKSRHRAARGRAPFQSPSLRGSGLFCAAVAAVAAWRRVSIPFIAGQWSLLPPFPSWLSGISPVSIPFIAGQWSLPLLFLGWTILFFYSFNPLHCGAVVSSGGPR